MLSNNQKKLIRSLHQKKYRELEGLFLVEGERLISDLIASGEMSVTNTILIVGMKDWAATLEPGSDLSGIYTEESEIEIKKLSQLVTPPKVFAVLRKPEYTLDIKELRDEMTLVFDAIRDPGNLGTIIRTADWFGIRNIICSSDSVDCFNGKTVQSSMGAIMRVKVHYTDLTKIFESATRLKIPVYATTMNGHDLYDTPVRENSLIVFGNESRGIGDELLKHIGQQIKIPDYPPSESGSESLNVASSVAVICSEVRRRIR